MSNEGPKPDDQNPTVSEFFQDADADIAFVSSDKVVFKLHRKHLETSADVFGPLAGVVVEKEPVPLEESSEVLEILFKFIEPPTEASNFCQPWVATLEADLFFEVAEASEKYLVFGLMNLCATRMFYECTSFHPLRCLNHAAKHGYLKFIGEKAATQAILSNEKELARSLTHPGILNRVILYRSYWNRLASWVTLEFEHHMKTYPTNRCPRFLCLYGTYMISVNASLLNAERLPKPDTNIPCPGHCSSCSQVAGWQTKLDLKRNQFPKFLDIKP